MEAGEIDTQQKQKKLLDGYAEELFEKRLEWANLQVSVRVLVREGWLWVWFICFVLDCCIGCGGTQLPIPTFAPNCCLISSARL